MASQYAGWGTSLLVIDTAENPDFPPTFIVVFFSVLGYPLSSTQN